MLWGYELNCKKVKREAARLPFLGFQVDSKEDKIMAEKNSGRQGQDQVRKIPDWIPKEVHGCFYTLGQRKSYLACGMRAGYELARGVIREDDIYLKLLENNKYCKAFWRGIRRKVRKKYYVYLMACIEGVYYASVSNPLPTEKNNKNTIEEFIKSLDDLINKFKELGVNKIGVSLLVGSDYRTTIKNYKNYEIESVIKNSLLSIQSTPMIPKESGVISEKIAFLEKSEKKIQKMIYALEGFKFRAEQELIWLNDVSCKKKDEKIMTIFCRLFYLETKEIIDQPVSIITNAVNIFHPSKGKQWETAQVARIIKKLK